MKKPVLPARLRLWPVAIAIVAALILPSTASALTFKISNESGRAPGDVYVTVEGEAGTYDVSGMTDNEPKKLSEIPGEELTINKLISGRIYISYGAGVESSVPFDSQTRFDWAELTVTPDSTDVANLTAVDQFGIGMRLDTFNTAGEHLETVGDANSDTIFNALQQIPGGPQATVRNANGEILRVLSPLHSSAYPDLGEYVRSMSGKTITLRTAFFGSPFTTTTYSGTFSPDGSIALHGTTDPLSSTPATIELSGSELIEDIYTGGNTPNDIEGAIRRDLLAGFSTGLWGGKYGDDALSFCSNPSTAADGDQFCPNGFNQPSFGDARASLSPFPTCEQYAAVINQYTDVYGNPYSDAAKKVTVSLDQPASGGDVKTLQLTILPDSGNAQPATSGNPNCGAAGPGSAPAPARRPATSVKVHFLKQAKVHGSMAAVARISCSSACGKIRALARKGQAVLARGESQTSASKQLLKLRLSKAGKKALARAGRLRVGLYLWITPPGQATTHVHRSLTLVKAGSD